MWDRVAKIRYCFLGRFGKILLFGKPDASEEAIIAAAKQANIHEFIMTLEQNLWYTNHEEKQSGNYRAKAVDEYRSHDFDQSIFIDFGWSYQ